MSKTGKNIQYRYENFGGIIASQNPPFLAFVDRDYMRGLGLPESEIWHGEQTVGELTAPTEVHFAITNKCSAGCAHCYMGAGKQDDGELSTADLKRAFDILSEMKVFHVALGGGEALEREDLFEIASYARNKGLVPNLTVSGLNITPENVGKMRVFGQVNVSMDGVGSWYGAFRSPGMFERANKAIELLVSAKISTGINCVVGKNNFDGIEELFKYAVAKRLNEIEFLRLKPSGRGMQAYMSERTSYEQNIAVAPLLGKLSSKYKITAKIDCSFVPMFCYHKPPRQVLNAIATYGCEAGNVLLGIRSNGLVSGCSFLKSSGKLVFDLGSGKAHEASFGRVSKWLEKAPEPCRSCDYLDICKGGCHAVSESVSGSFESADPDCPRVVEFLRDAK